MLFIVPVAWDIISDDRHLRFNGHAVGFLQLHVDLFCCGAFIIALLYDDITCPMFGMHELTLYYCDYSAGVNDALGESNCPLASETFFAH